MDSSVSSQMPLRAAEWGNKPGVALLPGPLHGPRRSDRSKERNRTHSECGSLDLQAPASPFHAAPGSEFEARLCGLRPRSSSIARDSAKPVVCKTPQGRKSCGRSLPPKGSRPRGAKGGWPNRLRGPASALSQASCTTHRSTRFVSPPGPGTGRTPAAERPQIPPP